MKAYVNVDAFKDLATSTWDFFSNPQENFNWKSLGNYLDSNLQNIALVAGTIGAAALSLSALPLLAAGGAMLGTIATYAGLTMGIAGGVQIASGLAGYSLAGDKLSTTDRLYRVMSGGFNVLGGNSLLKGGLKLTQNNSKILTGITNTIDSVVAKAVSTAKDIGRRTVSTIKDGIANTYSKVKGYIAKTYKYLFSDNKNAESKFEEVFKLANNYKLSDDVFDNHIMMRHGPESIMKNKSHFISQFDIKDGINRTLKGDNFIVRPNTMGRSGYIFEQTFNNLIGIDKKGRSLSTIKVVIDEIGNVVTAFPIK